VTDLEQQFAEFIKRFHCTYEHGAVCTNRVGTPFEDGMVWAFAQTFDFLRALPAPASTITPELLAKLRERFDAALISEVKRHGGIPSMPLEELQLRDTIAEILAPVPRVEQPKAV
jgi:hypothetical protein